MLDHLNINVSDIARSRAFYATALAPLGYAETKDHGDAVGFGVARDFGRSPDPGGDFWVVAGPLLTPRPHFAFSAETRSVVDAFFTAAIAAGGTDNGSPGVRAIYHPDYYAAFVLDPDGYNIEAVCHRAPAPLADDQPSP
jgi:catechol 2,3-dioxygenase-like lactoylglutathione lyase family enzyme